MSKKQYSVRTAAVAATERRARRSGVAVAASGSGSSNYIDIAGDVAGKLDREVFDSMFERVVTGVDDEGNETWYIKAKATLVSVRDVVAYGASDIIGGGGGSSTGGLNEEQLAAYLTANNYITQADLGNYVTALGTSDGYLTWTKNGVTNNITVPFATSTDFLNGVVPTAITDAPGNYKARLYVNVLSGTAGLFPSINNSNAILTISRHGGNFYSQLGFSSNGNMYYRSFNYVALDTTTAWDLVLTSGNYTSTLDSRYVNKAGDITTGNLCINTDSRYTSYNEGLRINANSGNGWATMFFGGAYGSTADVSNNGFIVAVNPQHQFVIAQGQSATNYGLSIVGTGASDLRWLNNTIWHAGNDGSGSDLDADLLDNCHNGDVTAKVLRINNAAGESSCFQFMQQDSGWQTWESPDQNWRHVIKLCHGNGDTYYNRTLAFDFFGHRIYTGKMQGGSFAGWKTIAFLDDNVASASKLQTARTIYINSYNNYRVGDGVAFDGTGDITLKLPNSITASNWFRSYGATGWYNETYGGGIYMSDTTWIKTWQQKSFYTGSGEIRSDSEFNRMGYGGSSWDNGYGAYNVAIYNNANQTPLLLAYRDGAGVAATGANRLFAIELLNNGAMLNFGFGGGARFCFYSSGTLVATGDVTAYSDMRLKSDIQTLTNRGFITPRTYIKDGKRSIGFLAQEVQQKYPELVMDTGGADHWLSLNYGNLVAVLEAQIIDHEDRIKRLEERI